MVDIRGKEMRPVGHPRYAKGEIARIGEEMYQREIRAKVETDDNIGKVLVLDIETGEYEIDEENLVAAKRLKAKNPDAALYAMRIGYPALEKIGGSWGAYARG
jgi:hypothetical protein